MKITRIECENMAEVERVLAMFGFNEKEEGFETENKRILREVEENSRKRQQKINEAVMKIDF